jgi:serine O-acetyltransferase
MPDASPSTDPPPAPLPTYGGHTWSGARALMAADYRALMRHFGTEAESSWVRRLYWFLLPSYLGLALYRVAHWAHARGWRGLARLIYLFKVYLTRIEIAPETVIGPEMVISHASGVTLDGHIGARCHIFGQCNTGRSFTSKDVGAGPGLPVLGDDIVIGYGAMVLGGVRVGHGARIGPGAVVTTDVPAGALVMWAMPRILQAGPA